MKLVITILIFVIISCSNEAKDEKNSSEAVQENPIENLRQDTSSYIDKKVENPKPKEIPTIKPEIIRIFPHDNNAYTQGLIYLNGKLFESTGQYGKSSLREVNISSGKVIRKTNIPISYFGEGISIINDELFMLTWRERTCFVFDLNTLEITAEMNYYSEGWGLTTIGDMLIMSDGSNYLRYLDPQTMEVKRTVGGYHGNSPLMNLNELEYAYGYIFANIYGYDEIAVIEPDSGELIATIDCSELRGTAGTNREAEVLNGIAYNPEKDTFVLTGKYWDSYAEVQINLD